MDHQNFYEIQQNGTLVKSFLRHPQAGFSFKANEDFIAHYQIYQKAKSLYKAENNGFDPEIVFLGTNSSHPSNFRNVSAIFVHMSNLGLLMDCGEGTYFQLFSHFGREKIEEVLLNLKIIYISHFHLDHCMGITEILVERNKILKRLGESPEKNKVFLVVPPNLIPLIEDFNNFIEEIKIGFSYVFSSELSSQMKNSENYEAPTLSKQNLEADEFTVDEFMLQPHLKSIIGSVSDSCASNLNLLKNLLLSLNLSFMTIKTPHCQDSHALIIKHNSEVKIVYSGDTKYCEDLITQGKNAKILIHEATFSQEEKSYNHSTFNEAIKIGVKMNAWRTVLTHFTKGSDHLDPKETLSSTETEKNHDLEKYAEQQVVLAVDHMTAKLSEFEYLPAINKCMNIFHPKGDL